MTKHNLKIVHANEHWLRAKKWINQGRQHARYGGEILPYILDKCRVSPSTLVVERALFNAVGGYDERLRVCEDYDLSMRLAIAAEFGYIEQKLVIKRDVMETSLSRGIQHIESVRLDILTEFARAFALNPAQLECVNREIERKRGIVKR
jgi:hypothetical protein